MSDSYNHTDWWGECTAEEPNPRCVAGDYIENVSGKFGKEEMLIFEPCNYASNIAFYRGTTRICDYPDWSVDTEQIVSIKRSFSALAVGSAMWHGSHTFVGYSFDNNLMAVIGYLAHQASVSGLSTTSSIVHELSDTARSKTAAQTSQEVTLMFAN